MNTASVAAAAWTAANTPGYWRYRRALAEPAAVQNALLRKYVRDNADTAFGRRFGFRSIRSIEDYQARVPIASYEDFSEAVQRIARGEPRVLTTEPVTTLGVSSGSVSAAKLIPYTAALQREFRQAVGPWIVDLRRQYPTVGRGCSYWSITPVASAARGDDRSPVRAGFDEDSEYLGSWWKPIVDATMAVPAAVRFVEDVDAFRYVTLRFLLERRDLSLMSVWHPSFLTLLLDSLGSHWPSLVSDVRRGTMSPPTRVRARIELELAARLRSNPRRAHELERAGPDDLTKIWPQLTIVSCWGDGHARFFLDRITRMLPHARIQPKGLLATEAVVTLPFEGSTPLAVRSHFFEFVSEGRVSCAHELEPGRAYTVVVTTGGGLYRYRLDDRVEVDGFVRATPSLRFLGKADHVSDLCGEKLDESFVARAVHDACLGCGVAPRFALVAPDVSISPPCYTLYLELEGSPPASLGQALDERLAANPHYLYCRRLGQLSPLRVQHTTAPLYPLYVKRCRETGQRIGDIKPLALSARSGWADAFGLSIGPPGRLVPAGST